jgi:autotransporter-associated beta strand protein
MVMEPLQRRILLTWIGATSGSTNDAAHQYDNTANWAGGVIDNSFSGVTLTGDTSLYFTTNLATDSTGLNLGYSGSFNLSLLSSSTTTQTLTLGGDVSAGPANQTVTIGDVTGTDDLNVVLGNATTTLNTAAGQTLVIANVVSGTGDSIVSAGAGTLTLSGANTFDGGTTLSAGTLDINNAAAIGTGPLTIDSGTTIDNTSGAAITDSNNNTQSWGGSFTFTGSNALNLGTGAVTMTASGTVTTSASTLTVGGIISGSGDSLTKAGAGALALSGANTFDSGTTLSAGTLDINNAAAIGTGTFTIDAGTTIDNTSGAAITNTNNNAQDWNGDFTFAGSSDLNLGAGNVTLGANRTVTVSNGTLTVGGAISGSFGLTDGGAGTLALAAASDYTGGLTVNGTVLVTSSGGNSALGSGNTTVNSGGTLIGGAADAFGYSPNVAPATINIDGGTVTDLGTSNYRITLPNLNFTGGALTAASGNAGDADGNFSFFGNGTTETITTNASSATAVISGGTCSFQSTTTFNVAASSVAGGPYPGVDLVVTSALATFGTGTTTTKSGAGVMQLSGANTFTGGATLAAGQLNIDSATALGTGTFTIDNGTTIDNTSGAAITDSDNNAQSWAGSFTFTGSNALNFGTGAVAMAASGTVTTTASTLTLGGIISGAGDSLTKAGAGALALAGSDTYSGGTTLSAGTLDINSTGAIGTGTFTINGGTINNTSAAAVTLSGGIAETWAASFTYTGTNPLNLGNGAITLTTNATVTASASTLTVGGIISGANSLTKAGAGSLALSGANTYSAGTTLSAGTLDINNATAIGTGTLTISGGTINNTSGAAITDSNNNAQSWGASFTFTGTNALNLGTGTVALGANLTVTTTASTLTIGGVVSGAHTLTKAGAGSLALSGANTYSTGTTLTAGILDINSATAIGTGTLTISAGTINNTSGGAITDSNNNAMSWNASFTFTGTSSLNMGTGAVTLTGNPTVTTTANTLTVGGVISGAHSLTKAGAGTLVLAGTNTYSTGTTLSAGILDINNAAAIGTGTFTINGGTIDNTSGAAITLGGTIAETWSASFTFTGTNNLNLGTGAVTLTGNPTVTTTGGLLTVGGIISGAHSLTKAGAGTLALSGANTYSTGTTLSAGTLDFNNATAIGTSTFTINGGTIDNTSGAAITDSNTNIETWAASFTFTGTSNLNLGTGAVTLTANATVTTTGGVLTDGGSISGPHSVAKAGAGELVLSGANGYSSGTTINAGTLSFANTSLPGSITFGGSSTLQWNGSNTQDVSNKIQAIGAGITATLDTNGNNVTLASILSGNGAIAKVGTGALTLSGANSYSGGTTLSAGTLDINNATAIGTSTFTIASGTTIDNTSGAAITLSTTNAQTWSGGFTFTGTNALNLGTGAVTLGASLTTTISASTLTVGGIISGTGDGLIKAGNGTLVVTGSNTYSGGTTISAGTMLVNDASGSGTGSGSVAVSNGGALGGTGTVSGAVTVSSGGNLSPGSGGTAIFNTGNLVLASGSDLNIALNGNTAGSGFDQVNVTGTVNVSGSTLNLSGSRSVHDGSVLEIIANDAADAVTGTFQGLSEGGATVYNGVTYTATYVGGTGNDVALTANLAATTTAVVSGNNPSTFNSSVTFTATVTSTSSGAPSGTVTFFDGATALGTGSVNGSGQATLSISSLSLGGHSITAVYGGDSNFTGSTSSTLTQTVTPGPPAKVVYSVQPSNVTAGVADSPSIVVDVEDQYGNIVTSDSSNVTLSIASGPGSLSGTVTVAASSGVATLSNVILDTAGSYTLTASDGSLTSATSNSFTVTPAAAAKVVYGAGPSNVTAGVANSPSIVVDVEDQFGNVVTSDSSNVTLAVASGPGSPTGTLTVAASSGVATFSAVILDTAGGYTLTASDVGLTSATSNSFTVTPAAAAKVVYGVGPSNVTAGVANSPSITVSVEDQFGNIVTSDSSNVTLSVAGGPGPLTGTVTVAASSGVATLSNVILDTAGSYTLTASDGSLTSATSNSFTVTPAAASKVVYGVQPSDVTAGVANSPSITVAVEDQFGNIVTSDASNVTLAVASGPGSLSGTVTVAASGGVATLSNVILDTAGDYTLTASDGSLTSATSSSFTVTPGASAKVVYGVQPSDVTAGVANSPSITVAVEDQFGNIVTSDSSNVSLSIASGPGSLTGTVTMAPSSGVATFSNVILDTAGTYTLTAGDGGLTHAMSNSFVVSPAAASKVVYGVQPSDVTAGVANSPSVVVDVEDQFGNIVTSDSSNVTLSVASGPGPLTGTLTIAASSGVATLSNVILDTAGNYTLTASDGSLTSATSNSFTVTPAAASKVVYGGQPSDVIAGVANNPSITVSVEDQFGNIVASDSSDVTLSVASGPGSLTGTVTVVASGGVATFSNVILDTAGTYTLTANDGSLTSATSNSFVVSPAAAMKVVYGVGPSNVTAGSANSPSIVVDVEDQFGNIVTSDSSNVTLAVASGPGSLTGTVTVAAGGGVAMFSNAILDTAGDYTLTASDGSLTSATSNSFTVTPAAAAKVVYGVQPSNVTAGVANSPSIVVDVEDQFGNVVTSDSSDVTLAVASGAGSLTGTLTVAASNGVATFSNVILDIAGNHTLTASDGSLTSAISSSFMVSPAAAAKVVYGVGPSNVIAGVADSPSITVEVEDQFGNVVTSDSSNVTLAVASGPGSASGTLTVAASSGVATFGDVIFDAAGTYSLTANDGDLTPATSNSFVVSPAAAAKVVYGVGPSDVVAGVAESPSITVSVEDQFGNIVTSDSSNVALAVASGPGSLSGTITVAASSGVALFSNVILDTTGTYTLTASDGGLTPATSNSFVVSPAAATKVVYGVQPSDVTAGIANSPSITVAVEDQFGNTVTSDGSSVSLSVASGPGSLAGMLTVAASGGVATFSNVILDTAGSYTLTASDGSLTSATSNSFVVSPAAAAKVVYSVQPSDVTAGVPNSPSIVVDVEDQFGNVVTSDSSDVTLSVASGPGLLTGTSTVAASGGMATLSNVVLDTTGTYTLTASDGSLTSATSNSFVVSPAAAAKVVYGVQPSDVTAGVADNPSIVVDVEDQFGNIVTNDSSNVTLTVASGPGSASGTVTVAASGGVAMLSDIILDTAGDYTLNVSDGSLTSATSGDFTVTPAAASQLVYDVQPSDVTAGVANSPSIVVDVEDQFGNIVSGDSSNVTLSVASGPGSLSGTVTVAAGSGVATLSNVILDTAGDYTLTASDGGLTSATSNSFVVSPAAAAKVAYGVQPSDVTAGVADSPSIVVDVEDQFGNIVTSNSSNVTLSVASGPGSLTGTLTVAANSGVATLSNVILDTTGTYTLTASDGSLAPATSNSFVVSPAAAVTLVYGIQPSNAITGAANSPSIVVDVEDQFGNIVTGDSSNVTLSIASGPGSLTGTVTVAASGGVATFSNITLHTAGTYTLTASDDSLTSTTSNSFTITAAIASRLVFEVQPSKVNVGIADNPSIVVYVEDHFGNIVTSDSSSVTVSAASGPGSASGTLTVAASGGVATFSNILFDTAGSYALIASDGRLVPAISSGFAVIGAALIVPEIVSTTNVFESLQVVYSDPDGIDMSSLTKGNIVVSGPANFLQAPRLLSVTPTDNGQTVTADYRVDPPAGGWTTSDNGMYSVLLAGDSVSDMNGTFFSPADLRAFDVSADVLTVAKAGVAVPTSSRGLSDNLSILGADNTDGSSLTYTWSAVKVPGNAKAPIFSSNGSNSARSDTVRFYKAGNYDLRCTITDAADLTITDLVSFDVAQTAAQIKMEPHAVPIIEGTSEDYGSFAFDQFGHVMDRQPELIYSILDGTGSINRTSGVYTASDVAGHLVIEVSAGNLTAIAGAVVLR